MSTPTPRVQEIETKPGESIIIERSSKMNRVRDAGLLIVAGLVFLTMFLGWRESRNRDKFIEERSSIQDNAIEQFKEDAKRLATTIENLKRELANDKKDKLSFKKISESLKNDLIAEHKRTRDMLFKAWLDHDAKLKKLTDVVERLEKGKKSE